MSREAMRSKASNLNNLDLIKFIAAILVVSIHTKPFHSLNDTLSLALENTIARIAVPLFFAASGYLFYGKINKREHPEEKQSGSYWFKYMKRLAALYFIWSFVYIGYDVYIAYRDQDHNILRSAVLYLRNFVFLGGHFHLWYFPALLFAITGLYWGLRMMPLRNLLIVAMLLYAVGLFGDAYFGVLGDNTMLSRLLLHYFDLFGTTRNGLFFGLVYVALGAYLYETRLTARYSRPGAWFALSVAGLILEVVLLNTYTVIRDCNMLIMLLPSTYFLFQMIIHKPSPNWPIDFKLLRDSSVLIYCSHGIFLIIYSKLFGARFAEEQSLLWFASVLFSSLALSILILRLGRSERANRYVSVLY